MTKSQAETIKASGKGLMVARAAISCIIPTMRTSSGTVARSKVAGSVCAEGTLRRTMSRRGLLDAIVSAVLIPLGVMKRRMPA